ncbi:CPBP family intramembrane glutamic endopeptidase [Nocardia sp. NPDC050413]|uniref:CPBP family intramembrane glutamic endopeptidase n=1 Tax=Nocardia sp. NPDC050413 TaxID=3155784 RepID=UPI0033C2CEB8
MALGLPLCWNNSVLPALGFSLRGRSVANVLFAATYTGVFRGRPNWLSASGLRWGLGSSAVVLAGYGAVLAIPALRKLPAEIAVLVPETSTLEWIAVHIPVGTVLAEEAVFRATLDPLLTTHGYPPALGAADFALWHIHPARTAGDSLPVTLAATTVAGLIFSALRRRADSATAPALLHLAINAGGALLPTLAAYVETRLAAGSGIGRLPGPMTIQP